MNTEKKLSGELLTDSEATLRLVDNILEELHQEEEIVASESARVSQLIGHLTARRTGLASLPPILLRAYVEIMGALDVLRQSRGVLERATVERVQRTHQKLREVSSATELAATDMLNGLDHALQLVDRLDAAGEADAGGAAAVRGELRDELFRLMSCLQFQDITAQQLNYASSVLLDVEERIVAIASLFDSEMASASAGETDGTAGASGPATFDPAASMLDAEHRQAMADEIFTLPGAGRAASGT